MIVLCAATESTAPTKATGVSLPRKRLPITRICRASALGSPTESGGRKKVKPVEPPTLMARAPPFRKRLARISMLALPPLHWIELLPISLNSQRAMMPRWHPTWSIPLPPALPRANSQSSTA